MTDVEIDLYYKQTPCLCGATDTWHQECFAGKSREQVHADYDRVYAQIRRKLAKERKATLRSALSPQPQNCSHTKEKS